MIGIVFHPSTKSEVSHAHHRSMHLRDASVRSLHLHVGRTNSVLDVTALRTISFYRPNENNFVKELTALRDTEDESEQRELLLRLTTNTPKISKETIFEFQPLFGGTMEVELPLNWDLLSSSSFKESKEIWQDTASSLILKFILIDKQCIPKNKDIPTFFFEQDAEIYKIPTDSRHHAPISLDFQIPALPEAVLWFGKGTMHDNGEGSQGRVYQLEQCIVRLSKQEKDLAVSLAAVHDTSLSSDDVSPLFCRLLKSLRVQSWGLFKSTPTRNSVVATS